ncbi:MAG: MOSC domain-containing protein [Planctomycetota bacterium]
MVDVSMRIVAVHVGRIRQFDTGDDAAKPWSSAIIKSNVGGSVALTALGLEGDQQADRKHHGGVDKAVLTYPQCHLEAWPSEFPSVPWAPGSFGENWTLGGVDETDVCIGDVFERESAHGEICAVQVSQPREPCWKLSRRWGLPKLAVRVAQTRRTGWYCRVLRPGVIAEGESWRLVDRPHPQWSIAAANEVMFAKPQDPDESARLAQCDALSDAWKSTLRRR